MAEETKPTMSEQQQTPEPTETHSPPGMSAGGEEVVDVTAPEAAAPAVAPAPSPMHTAPGPHGWWIGTGRRKSAVARVRLKPGNGQIAIKISKNKTKTIDEYFTEERDRADAVAPLKATGVLGKMDVVARLSGGGYMGQAQALRLGVARALRKYDTSLEHALRDAGFLTRDPREVERKKYGQAGARRRFQFSKR